MAPKRENKYFCPYCPKRYKTSHKAAEHILLCKGPKPPKVKSMEFGCVLCNKPFQDQKALITHMSSSAAHRTN